MIGLLPTKGSKISNKAIFTATVILILSFQKVFAQFEGDFAPENWTFNSDNADANLDDSQAPNAITLRGGNDGSPGDTDYTITVTQAGEIKFSWFYLTNDESPTYDPAGYIVNGTFTPIVELTGSISQSGSASVTVANGDIFGFRVTTNDGGLGAANLTIENFTAFKNASPSIDDIEDVFVGVNSAPFVVNLNGIDAGISETGQIIAISATSNNTAIIPDPVVTYSSPDATGSLMLSPVTDAFGTAEITVTVSDDGGTANGGIDNIVKTFNVDVNSNFPPQIDALNNLTLSINELEQQIPLTGIMAGKNPNESQIITITASSSNQALINNNTIFVDYLSPSDNGTLRFTPEADATGQTTLTLTLMDNGGTANGGNDTSTETFLVKINENQSPSINTIDDLSLAFNAPQQDILFNGVSSGDGFKQEITITATSDNPGLIPDPTVTYTSPNQDGKLTITPASNQFGIANITVTVMDDGGTVNGGVDTFTTSFSIQINGNYPPTLDPIDDLVLPVNNGQVLINLTGISAGLNETQALTVTAMSDNVGLIPNPTVTYSPNDPTGSIEFTPTADVNGTATVTITVQDDGGTANGGTDTFSQSFLVQIATNLPPTVDPLSDLKILKNSEQQTVNLSGISAGIGETQNVTINVTSDNPALVADFDITYNPNDPTGSFSFSPIQDQIGTATISVTVSDDGGTQNNGIDTTIETFELTVSNSFSYTASTVGAANFERPVEGTPPLSITSGNFPYHVQPFTVSQSGVYTIRTPNANYNPFLIIYNNGFNPSDSRSNALVANDDDPSGDLGTFSSISLELTSGIQYFAVTTSSQPDISGSFTVEFVGFGDINLGVQPTLNFIDDVVINEDEPTTIDLSGISDGLGGAQSLIITATSGNQAIFTDIPVTYENGSETGSLSLSSIPNANGEAVITVVVTANNIEFERSFTIIVNPINDSPEFTLDQTNIQVNQDFSDEITINVIPDPVPEDEISQSVVYSITPINSDLANVTVDPVTGEISINAITDAFGVETFTVTADDQEPENNMTSNTFSLNINARPTDIALSNDLIEEGLPVGSTVGTLTSTDPDNTDGFRYSLVEGNGDDNNTDFMIENGTLITNTAFDVAILTEFKIRIRTEDENGAGFEKAFIIKVDDVTGIEDEFLSQSTKIWPNPSTGKFRLSTQLPTLSNLDIFVTDLQGKVIKHHRIKPASGDVYADLELSDVQSGFYLLKIKTDNGRGTIKRIVKE